MPPHFRARQVMRIAVHTPHAPLYFGIEHEPVGRVHPFAGNSRSGTSPGSAAVFASEQADIGISNEHPLRIEGIEVNAVSGGHVQTDGCPSRGIDFARIEASPSGAAVGGTHGSAQVCADAKVRILLCDCEV